MLMLALPGMAMFAWLPWHWSGKATTTTTTPPSTWLVWGRAHTGQYLPCPRFTPKVQFAWLARAPCTVLQHRALPWPRRSWKRWTSARYSCSRTSTTQHQQWPVANHSCSATTWWHITCDLLAVPPESKIVLKSSGIQCLGLILCTPFVVINV